MPPGQGTPPRPGYPPPARLSPPRPGYPPSQGTPLARVPPQPGTPPTRVPPRVPPLVRVPPSQGTPPTGPGRVPPPRLPHSILGNVAKHYGIRVPPPPVDKLTKWKYYLPVVLRTRAVITGMSEMSNRFFVCYNNVTNLVNTQGRAVDFNSSLDSIDSSYVNTVE